MMVCKDYLHFHPNISVLWVRITLFPLRVLTVSRTSNISCECPLLVSYKFQLSLFDSRYKRHFDSMFSCLPTTYMVPSASFYRTPSLLPHVSSLYVEKLYNMHCHTYRLILRSSSAVFYLFLITCSCLLIILLLFLEASFSIPMGLHISALHFPSSVKYFTDIWT